MKKYGKAAGMLLAIVLMAVGAAAPALAAEAAMAAGALEAADTGGRAQYPPGAVVCATAEELDEALGRDEGGDIYLSDHLEYWPGHTGLPIVTNPTTVHMGEYSITVMPSFGDVTDQLYICGPITFIGEETLFVLPPGTRLFFADDQAELWAVGENACAILGMQEETWNRNVWSKIYAVGENAVGIAAHGSLNLTETIIYARDGAVPVRCDGDVVVEHSLLANESGGPVFAPLEGDEIGLVQVYASSLSPVQQGIWCPPGQVEEEGWRAYLAQGDTSYTLWDLEMYISRYFTVTYDLSGMPEGVEFQASTLYDVPLEWDLSGLDPATLGVYQARGIPRPAFEIPDFPVPEIQVAVNVIPRDKAWIRKSHIEVDWGQDKVGLRLEMVSQLVGAEKITVYGQELEENGWSEWADLTAWGRTRVETFWGETSVWVYGLEVERTYRFYLEIEGGAMDGRSNTLEVDYDENMGGDRDLGDRDPDEAPPAASGPQAPADTPGAAAAEAAAAAGAAPPAPLPAQGAAGGGPEAKQPLPGPDCERQYLRDLMEANPLRTTLFAGAARITIPTDTLRLLLGTGESLNASAGAVDAGTIQVRLWVGETAVDAVEGGVEVAIPYPYRAGEAECRLVAGDTSLPAVVREGTLFATITGMGEYAIVFDEEPAAAPETVTQAPGPLAKPEVLPDKGGWPAAGIVLPVCFVAAGGAVAVPLGLRMRRKKG